MSRFDHLLRKFDRIGDRFDARKKRWKQTVRGFQRGTVRGILLWLKSLVFAFAKWVRRYAIQLSIATVLVAGIVTGLVMWRRSVQPADLNVTLLSDFTFRTRHADWQPLLEARFHRMESIFRDDNTRVRLHLLDNTLDTTGSIQGLENRRVEIGRRVSNPADILVAVTAQSEGTRTGSTGPFSHVSVVVDFPNESEDKNGLIMAHEVAHLFGAQNDTSSGSSNLMSVMPGNDTLPPAAIAAIRASRTYHFAAGPDGLLEGSWDSKSVDILSTGSNGSITPAQAHGVVAAVLMGQFRRDEALRHLREAVRIAPQDFMAHNSLGIALARAGSGQDEQALSEFKTAAKLDPKNVQIQQSIGTLLIRMNRLDEAAEALHQAQLLDPNNATTESLLGVAFSQEPGHEQDALAAFREASRLNPQMGLGTAMSQQLSSTRIQYLEELSEQSKRVEHNPGDAEAHYKLGMAQAKLGRPAEAFQEMQKAIQLRPGYGDAHAALARFYYMRREYSPAWDEVEKAKAGGTPPPDDLVQKLEKKLPKLR